MSITIIKYFKTKANFYIINLLCKSMINICNLSVISTQNNLTRNSFAFIIHHLIDYRCGKYDNIPLDCQFVHDQKDPTCCRVAQCSVRSDKDTSVFYITGFFGHFTGYGRSGLFKRNISQIAHTWYSSTFVRQCFKGLTVMF